MGWLEFQGWLAAMGRQQKGREPDPFSWSGTENDPHWQELRAKRDAQRGR